MIGAPALAANAALRGGAGLVTIAAPEPVQLSVATLCLCATSIPLSCRPDGTLGPSAIRQVLDPAEESDVLAVGPGMGVSAGAAGVVRAVLEQDAPVVLDADGLNNLLSIDHWREIRRCPIVLTPHPGELARLTGASPADIQADRERAAMDAAGDWLEPAQTDAPLVLVLKGAGTVVTDGEIVYVNDTGNPGMATGGTGDVLTGLIAALIAQGLSLWDAACLGAHIHGLAGDLAVEDLGEMSLTALDVVDYIPDALGQAIE
ncbi:MAG TPA: NAD(P)H-hydrate dehydratase [Phycisphaerae bacterium]|nr:NAD(P)H-hydrate dehydratase [Phycisphaerae bacterium]